MAPAIPRYYIGPKRSVLHSRPGWQGVALGTDSIKLLAAELKSMAEQPAPDDLTPGLIVVIEGVSDILNTLADAPLVALIRAARHNGHLIIAENETAGWASSFALLAELKSSRRGIILQPDPIDGDVIFKTVFPRVARADYPPGRGVYTTSGKTWTVQLPLAS